MSGPFGPREDEPQPPEEDDEQPPPKRPPSPKPAARFAPPSTWLVGVAALVVLLYITVNSITTDSPGSRGIRDGDPLPAFTAPLALANLKCENSDGDMEDCDASVALKERNGHPPACDIRLPDTFNSCVAEKQGPLALAFLAAPSDECTDSVDQFNRLAKEFPDVQFAVVAIRGDHEDLNKLIRRQNWTVPVAYDHDGAVANSFAVAICPTITFAYKGGTVAATTFGEQTDVALQNQLRRIQAGPTTTPTPSPTP